MKLKNFFFAALAATFAFASCEQADPNGGKDDGNQPAEFVAGDYWLIANDNGIYKSMSVLPSDKKYGSPVFNYATATASVEADVYTFTAVEGGFSIKDSEGRYICQNPKDDGTYYTNFNVQTENPTSVWKVELQSNGTAKIIYVENSQYIQYSTSNSTWECYPDEKGLMPMLVKVTNPLEAPVYPSLSNLLTSNITWAVNADTKSYSEKVKVNGSQDENDCLKLGTGSKVGTAELTVPAGVSKIGFYGVAWNGKDGKVVFKNSDGIVVFERDLVKNPGANNTSPYSITVEDDRDYYEFEYSSTTESTLTVETVANKYRVVLWGINAK